MASNFNDAINKASGTNSYEGSYLNNVANKGNVTFSAMPSSMKESLDSLEKALPITKQIEEAYKNMDKIAKTMGKKSDEYVKSQEIIKSLEEQRFNQMSRIANNSFKALMALSSEEEKAEMRRVIRRENEEKAEKAKVEKALKLAKQKEDGEFAIRRKALEDEQKEIDKMESSKGKRAAQRALNARKQELAADEKAMGVDTSNDSDGKKIFKALGKGALSAVGVQTGLKSEEEAIKSNDSKALKQLADLAEASGDKEEAERLRQASEDAKQAKREETKAKLLDGIKNTIASGFSENARIAKQILEDNTKYASRLQGYSISYKEAVDKISKTIGMSPFIKQEDTVKNLNMLLERGIVYNVEQRAFLATVSDKVAATFDKQNETLERLIRIQQADSTAARLGLEASLTKLFNGFFEDTSYLASNTLDQVTSALIEAESQMTRDQAIEFEYTIQKWLGSLYSLGLSQSAVTSIAGGLGQLASGNISALQGTPLQTLFALSSSKSGLSYSDMLINSIDGSSVNELLKAMVSYLKEIAEGDNQVVKSAYGKIFGLSQSDFRALQNVAQTDIDYIYRLQSNYTQAMQEVEEQLSFSNLFERTTIGAMTQNIIENFKYSWGASTASDPLVSAMIQVNDIINSMTYGLGIQIPTVSIHGYSFSLNNSINNIITTVGQAATLLGSLAKIFTGLSSSGGLDLNAWGAKEYTRRGSGFKGIASGLRKGTSISSYVASGSTSDMESSTLEEQSKKGKETKESVFEGEDKKDYNASEHKFDELFDLFNDRTTNKTIKVTTFFDESASPLLPIINNQNDIKKSLGTENKDTLYSLLQAIKKAVENPKAQLNIEGNKFASQLRAALQGIIAGGTELDGIPSEISIGEALIGIYDILNGNSTRNVKVSVENVNSSVPGFGGLGGNKINVRGIY